MSEPNVVRVATFNAHHAADDGLFRHRALVDTCRGLDADILGLQEVDRRVVRTWFRDQPRIVSRALAMRCAVAPAKRHHFFGHQCNALCTRGALHDLTTLTLPQPTGLEPRNAIVARVVLPGLELSVAVTHLQHRPRSNARPQLELVLETLSMRPGPHLLLGDLNLAAGEAVPLLEAAGFTPAPVGFTSPRRAPREQIDWIACRDLSVVHAEVHEPLVSDHLPVVATLATLPAGS